jgi:hypothetical protein
LGEDFAKAIETTVAKCDVLVAVIGNNWLNSKDDHGDSVIVTSSNMLRRRPISIKQNSSATLDPGNRRAFSGLEAGTGIEDVDTDDKNLS